MSTTINIINIRGVVGKDPLDRYTKVGKVVVTFDVAYNDKYKSSKTGKLHQVTRWHKIVALNGFATYCMKNIKKGDKVLITGEEHNRETKNKFNATIKIVEVILFSDKCKIEKLTL